MTDASEPPLPGADANATIVLGTGDRPAKPFAQEADAFLRHLSDACPLVTADPHNPGDPPARYVLQEELGAGSIGQVVAARDEHLGRRVAIKILNGGSGVTKDRIARFLVEAQVTAQLEHPAIVPVHEIGRMPGGLPYFAMKLVLGQSMEGMIARLKAGDRELAARHTPEARLRLFHRICQGMAYAHAKGVVHRDLKPANILVGLYGEVQIMDWGLAKVARESEESLDSVRVVRAEDDDDIAGTPAYMAPEQARGMGELVGPASDVYSLGLILAELISFERVAGSIHATTGAERFTRPVEVERLKTGIRVAPEIAAVIRRCTDPDPKRRYPDAAQLATDIRDCMEDRVPRSLAGATSRARTAFKWLVRHPLWGGVGLTLAAEGLLVLAWYLSN